jgi:molybdenum cofactor guanylyltransferase
MMKALILVGGKSSRMGVDKYLLEVNGKPQYQYIYEMLQELNIPAFISCTSDQSININSQYNTIIDQYNEIGPIGGLASAILADKKSSWLLIACDLINLKSEAILDLIKANNDHVYDIVTFGTEQDGFLETTLTIYNPGSFIVIKRKVRDQQHKMQELMRKCTVKTILPKEKSWLKNANTKEDLQNE